jgi:hypothetical protein
MTPAQALEAATLALLELRKQEPEGTDTLIRLKGNNVVLRSLTYLEQAREEARTVLEAAVPGFLQGAMILRPREYGDFS